MIASGNSDPRSTRARGGKSQCCCTGSILPMRLGFESEWAARAPAAAAGVAAVFGVYWLGTLWWSSLAGLVAATGLATTFRFAVYAAGVDRHPGCGWYRPHLPGAEYATHPSRPPGRRQAWWAGWLAAGLTALIKGPLAAIAPVIWLLVAIGTASSVRSGGVRSSWGVCWPRSWAVPGISTWRPRTDCLSWSQHRLRGRAAIHRPSFPGPSRGPLFYSRILPGELAPWSLLVALVGSYLVSRGRSLDPPARHGVATATAWFFGVMLLCWASDYKLPHYALPAYPAAFLLVGFVLDNFRDVRAGEPLRLSWASPPRSGDRECDRAGCLPRLPEAFRPGVTAVSATILVGGLAGLAMLRKDVVTGSWSWRLPWQQDMRRRLLAFFRRLPSRRIHTPHWDRWWPTGLRRRSRSAPLASTRHSSTTPGAMSSFSRPPMRRRDSSTPEPRLTVLSDCDLERVRSTHRTPLIVIASRRQRHPRLSHLLDGRFVRGTGDVLLVGNQPAAGSMRAGL